jgi:hypothetical protein
MIGAPRPSWSTATARGGWFYVPREGLMAFKDGDAHAMRWMHPDPRLASVLKRTARGMHAYPGPRVTAVTVGKRRVERRAPRRTSPC